MQETASIQCPFCGECFELVIDATQPAQRFTTDCEICCRPMRVSVTCEAGEILDLQATPD